MMKTSIEIRDDIFRILKDSEIAKEANGKLCNKPQRPLNSVKEDICIGVISNENIGQDRQLAVVQVNVYCQDINHDGQMEENTSRLRVLERKLEASLDWYNGGDFYLTITRLKSHKAEGIDAHFAQAQLTYHQNNY